MRKILISALILICAVTLACGCAPKTPTSSSGGSSVNAEISIKSLVVKKMPTKTEYFEGENFDPTGMIIEAVWYDDYTDLLTKTDYAIENGENLTVGLTSVTVTFEDGRVEVPVTVKAFAATGIRVTALPEATDGLSEGLFDFSGLKVVAFNAEKEIQINDYSLFLGETEIDKTRAALAPGNNLITVKYKDFSTEFKVRFKKGYRVEFENILSFADVTLSEKNFIEKTSTNYQYREMTVTKDYASEGKYMGYVAKNDVIRMHAYSEEAITAEIVIVAASNRVTQYRRDFYPNDSDWWIPVAVGESRFDYSFFVSLNGEAITLGEKVLPGSVALNEDGTVNTMGDINLTLNWTEVSLGIVTLKAGDNILDITCVGDVAANFDYAEVRFIGEHEHNAVTLDRIDEVASTCEKQGNIEYYCCSVCNKKFADGAGEKEITSVLKEEVPHTLDGLRVVSSAAKTVYAVGEKFDVSGMLVKAHCSVCNKDWNVTDYLVASEIKSGDTLVTLSYTLAGVTKTCEQQITVLNQYFVEAEKAVNWWESVYFNPNNPSAADEKIFVDKTGIDGRICEDGSASGGKYVGFFNAADKKMLVYIYSDVECDAEMVLRASSSSAKKVANDYGATENIWNPVEMKDIVMKDGYTLSYRYEQNAEKTYVEMASSVVVKGGKALNADGSVNEKGDISLYVNWADVSLGTIRLKRGANIIELASVSGDYAINVDSVTFRFI